ncbi:MAG: tripartite tricarboxylate transporter substrate binding protein [Burkholderiaceae bacterium]
MRSTPSRDDAASTPAADASPATAPGAPAVRRARRLTVLGLTGAVALAVLAAHGLHGSPAEAADAWPSKPIRLVIPYPPGGAADAAARIFAEALSEGLHQQVLPENKPGAGTAIAADHVAASAPDGYTLSLVPTGQLTVLPHIQQNLKFDPFTSFAPISMLAATGVVIATNDSVPARDLKELIALAKSQPGKLTYSSSGSGTIIHLAGEYFKLATGTDLLHVPFKGSAPAITAVVGGHVNVSVDTLTVLAPQIKAGKLKGLALASKTRSPLLPDVPTVAESGYPDFEVVSWFGLAAPAGTPPDIIARLNAEVRKAADTPSVKERLAQQGLEAWATSPEQFAQRIRADYDKYGKVVRESGVKFD